MEPCLSHIRGSISIQKGNITKLLNDNIRTLLSCISRSDWDRARQTALVICTDEISRGSAKNTSHGIIAIRPADVRQRRLSQYPREYVLPVRKRERGRAADFYYAGSQ